MVNVLSAMTCLLSLYFTNDLVVSGAVVISLLSITFGKIEACSVQCSES